MEFFGSFILVVENQEEVKMNTDYITLVDEDFINNKRKYVEHTNKNDTEQERIKKEKVEDVILPDVEIEGISLIFIFLFPNITYCSSILPKIFYDSYLFFFLKEFWNK